MDRILISLKKENGPRASSASALGLNTIIFKHVYWYMQQTQVSVYRTIGPLVSPYHKDFTAIAHNAKGYDNYFVLEYLIDNSIRPEIIYNGSKIMYMQVKRGLNIRCLVSLNFLSMKLADLPRAFGFSSMYSTLVPYVAAEQLAALAYGSLTLGDGVMGNTLSQTVCLLIMLVSGNQITLMQIIDQLQLL